MWMHRQLFEVLYGFLNQTKFEHQDTVVEPTDEMVWIEKQTSFQLLHSCCQVSSKSLLCGLQEVVVRSFALSERCTGDRHDSEPDSNRIKSLLCFHCLSADIIALMFIFLTGPVLELVAHDTIIVITLSIEANFDFSIISRVGCTLKRRLASAGGSLLLPLFHLIIEEFLEPLLTVIELGHRLWYFVVIRHDLGCVGHLTLQFFRQYA